MHLVRVGVGSSADADVAAGRLWLHGPSAVEEAPAHLLAGFLRRADAERAADDVASVLPSVEVALLDPPPDDEWRDRWRAHAEPVRVGQVVVVPAWCDDPAFVAGEVPVHIEPGHAFGIGSHPSTRLLLGVLQDLPLTGWRVADVGCGSGVLAVTAVKLGAADTWAVDLDPDAIEVTGANAARNGVTVHTEVGSADVLDGTFDLVLANVGAAALCAMAGEIVAHLRPGGVAALAGLLDAQESEVAAAFRSRGCRLEGVRLDEGWAAPLLRKLGALDIGCMVDGEQGRGEGSTR